MTALSSGLALHQVSAATIFDRMQAAAAAALVLQLLPPSLLLLLEWGLLVRGHRAATPNVIVQQKSKEILIRHCCG